MKFWPHLQDSLMYIFGLHGLGTWMMLSALIHSLLIFSYYYMAKTHRKADSLNLKWYFAWDI